MVWVLGSSLVTRAFVHARASEEGIHLGLQRYGFNLWWQGKGGMHWNQVLPSIETMLEYQLPPKVLVIHCAGNDIGRVPLGNLRHDSLDTLHQLRLLIPSVHIIWSQILPRKWKYGKSGYGEFISWGWVY